MSEPFGQHNNIRSHHAAGNPNQYASSDHGRHGAVSPPWWSGLVVSRKHNRARPLITRINRLMTRDFKMPDDVLCHIDISGTRA